MMWLWTMNTSDIRSKAINVVLVTVCSDPPECFIIVKQVSKIITFSVSGPDGTSTGKDDRYDTSYRKSAGLSSSDALCPADGIRHDAADGGDGSRRKL